MCNFTSNNCSLSVLIYTYQKQIKYDKENYSE